MTIGLDIWPAYSWETFIPAGATLQIRIDGASPQTVTLTSGWYRGLAASGSLLHHLQDRVNAVQAGLLGAPAVDDSGRFLRASWALAVTLTSLEILDGTFPTAAFGIVSGTFVTFLSTPDLKSQGPWRGVWGVRGSTSIRFDERWSHAQTRSAYVGTARTSVARGSIQVAEDEHLLVPGRYISERYMGLGAAYVEQAGLPSATLTAGTLSEMLHAFTVRAPREFRPGDATRWLWRHTSLSALDGVGIDLDAPGDLRLSDLATAEGGGRRYRVRIPWVQL